VGGRGTLYGAVAGAVLVNYLKTYFTTALPEYWLYMLGLIFVLVTILLPKGVVGLLATKLPRKSAGGSPPSVTSDEAKTA
jgi:urea transport system permease protein